MKKILIPIAGLCFITLIACNNLDNKKDDKVTAVPKTTADSLENEVMDGHNAAMAKYGKLQAMQNEAQHLLDSIAALPAKALQAAATLKTKLGDLVEDLKSAKANMDKWMDEYNMDSAKNDIEQRIKYLAEEKLKVNKIKDAILIGLQRADSVLKAKL